MTVEERAKALYDNLEELNEMNFGDFTAELDLLAFLLGKKCSYELPARLEV